MKRRNSSRLSSIREISRKDIVPTALEKFRNELKLSSPEEFSTENSIHDVTEKGKKKVIEEFMPFILKTTVHGVYDLVVELEAGIQPVIQDFLKTKVPQDAFLLGSHREEGSPEVRKILKTGNEITTTTIEWTSAASATTEDGTCIPKEPEELERLKSEAFVSETSKEVEIVKVNDHHRVETRTLPSRMMDFAFNEFKSSLSLTPVKIVPQAMDWMDPSARTEILKFVGTDDNDAGVKLAQFPVDANQGHDHGSSLEPGPEIAIVADPESTSNTMETKNFRKLESLILRILEEIKYPEDYHGKPSIPVSFPGMGYSHRADDINIGLEDLRDCVGRMKRLLLKKYKTWTNPEYRQLHARLVEAVKIGEKVLLNARYYYSPCIFIKGQGHPPLVYKGDWLLWSMSFDMDVRGCLPSQKDSPKFKLDRAEYHIIFLRTLIDTKLIEEQKIRLNFEGENLGQQLLDLVKSKSQCQAAFNEMKARHSRDLCVEAVYFYWKLRAQKLDLPWNGKDLHDVTATKAELEIDGEIESEDDNELNMGDEDMLIN